MLSPMANPRAWGNHGPGGDYLSEGSNYSRPRFNARALNYSPESVANNLNVREGTKMKAKKRSKGTSKKGC